MFRVLSDIWMGHFCRGVIGFELWSVFVGCVQRCVQSLLTGASEVGLFAVVPTDLPQISENKYLLFQSMSLKFKLQLGI